MIQLQALQLVLTEAVAVVEAVLMVVEEEERPVEVAAATVRALQVAGLMRSDDTGSDWMTGDGDALMEGNNGSMKGFKLLSLIAVPDPVGPA
jgi:hypothetical protein